MSDPTVCNVPGINHMKNNITLDVDHPNKVRMEYFLNQVDEKIKQIPFDWQGLKQAGNIIAGYKFTNPGQTLIITVIFCNSYHEGTEIAKANSFPLLPQAMWALNGDLLYLVDPEIKR